jgi:hypothetical protein
VSGPWDFETARLTCRQAAAAQEGAEEAMREAYKDYADKERAYRMALADKIRRLKLEGMAATAAQDVARGDQHVAALRHARDVAEGVREVQVQVLRRRSADRRDAQRFADWSARRDREAVVA